MAMVSRHACCGHDGERSSLAPSRSAAPSPWPPTNARAIAALKQREETLELQRQGEMPEAAAAEEEEEPEAWGEHSSED